MKKTFLTLAIVIFSSWLLSSCNSTSYELEEVEVASDTLPYSSKTNPDIKQEIDQSKTEIKEDPVTSKKNTYSTFTVQIGAFEIPSNAYAFLEKAKKNLQLDINYIILEGLYKIRISTIFNKKDEALQLLYKVRSAGYDDSFVIETKYQK
jgi:hypothetical protein